MKYTNFKTVFVLTALITFSSFMAKSQTYLSGTGTNNCATFAAGTVGTNCTYIGCGAGFSVQNGIYRNTFIGDQTGYNTYTLNDNVGVGYQALYTQVGNVLTYWPSYNVAVGNGALYTNNPTSSTTGISNTAIGHNALYNNTTGDDNTALGFYAGRGNTTGTGNAFLGYRAGRANTTGDYNVFSGRYAGQANTTGSNNTFLGYYADAGSNNLSNAAAIGNGASVTATNDFVIGNSSVANLRCQQQTILALSDRRVKNNIKENVPGLAFINLLKPVTYHLDIHLQNSIMGYPTLKDSLDNVIGIDTTYWEGKYDIEKVQYSGFIAQQVDSAAQQIGYDFSGVYRPKNSKDFYGLGYTTLVVPLVKAVQELSNKVDSLIALTSPTNTRMMNNNSNQGGNENKQEIKLKLPVEIMMSEARPNPNDGKAEIDYYLPSSVLNAKIIFTDMLGNVINEVQLTTGYGTIAVDTQDLPNGNYTFSLIINGKVYNSKKMIRNK